jgi:hypothetical protein
VGDRVHLRHTVCTLLGQAGESWRDIANHIGHTCASITMDVHASRHTLSERTAELLILGR